MAAAERAKVADKKVTENGTVEFSFVGDAGSLICDPSQLSEEMKAQLVLHGIKQKVGDAYSGVKGDVEEAVKLAQAAWENLLAGRFSAARESSGTAGATELAKALAEVTGKDLAVVIARLEEMSKEERKELRENKRIAIVLARYKRERAEKAEKEAMEKAGDLDDINL